MQSMSCLKIFKSTLQQQMQSQEDILSLWIGSNSQRLAHHFYNLQAEQFFDQSQDPTNHHALWRFKDKDMEEKIPKMIVFDTESDHLTRIRQVSHKKMLKKMSQPTQEQMHFNFQMVPPQEEEQEQDPDALLYDNWQATEANYQLIDKKFQEERPIYELWQGLFKAESDQYEDKIRRYLEQSDSLSMFSICSDGQKTGFTCGILDYLKDECPKKSISLLHLSQIGQNYSTEVFLPFLGRLAGEVNLLVDLQVGNLEFPYFGYSSFSADISPLFNSFLTPFMLNNANSGDYLFRIGNQPTPLYNMAYTLPLIDSNQHLSPLTNAFQFLADKSKLQEEDTQNRINYANRSFLDITRPFFDPSLEKVHKVPPNIEHITAKSKDILFESYVLKGHFAEMKQLFPQRQSVQLKYLAGVLAANPKHDQHYHPFLAPSYGQIVESYPFHSVMFQHAQFGPAIRNYIKAQPAAPFNHEYASEWKEVALALADRFKEEPQDSD